MSVHVALKEVNMGRCAKDIKVNLPSGALSERWRSRPTWIAT